MNVRERFAEWAKREYRLRSVWWEGNWPRGTYAEGVPPPGQEVDLLQQYRAYLAAWTAAREEAVETLRLLRPNSEGYRRTEWEGFNFDLPTADAIDEAFNVGIAAIRSRLDAASRDGGRE